MHASTRQPAVSLKICESSVRACAVASVSYIDLIWNSMWSTCMLRTWKKPMAGPAPDSARGWVYLQFFGWMPRMAQRDWLMYTDVGCTQCRFIARLENKLYSCAAPQQVLQHLRCCTCKTLRVLSWENEFKHICIYTYIYIYIYLFIYLLSKEVGKQYFRVTDFFIWWRVVRDVTIHHVSIHQKRIDYDEGWCAM